MNALINPPRHSSLRGCILCEGQPTATDTFLKFEVRGAPNELIRCGCGLIYLRDVPDTTALSEH